MRRIASQLGCSSQKPTDCLSQWSAHAGGIVPFFPSIYNGLGLQNKCRDNFPLPGQMHRTKLNTRLEVGPLQKKKKWFAWLVENKGTPPQKKKEGDLFWGRKFQVPSFLQPTMGHRLDKPGCTPLSYQLLSGMKQVEGWQSPFCTAIIQSQMNPLPVPFDWGVSQFPGCV